jgi:2-dehydro-3-deoxygalactonokinase
MSVTPVLIGVDWGTSSFRAYLINSTGGVIDSISAPEGILNVSENDFESAFERLIGQWLHDYPTLPIVLSGMITSRNGWFEIDYVPVPARISEIASALVEFETTKGRKLHFGTGLVTLGEGRAPDVMRGEETELIGQFCHHDSDGLFLLPGTHSKWVRVEDRSVTEFETYMTGEVFALLKQHSILGKFMIADSHSAEAFDRGVKWRTENEGSILHTLFSVRTLPLFEQMATQDVSDYLSGLLIAEEICGALATRQTLTEVTVIGRGDLAERYCRALELMGKRATAVDQGLVARGHFELAHQRGLIT